MSKALHNVSIRDAVGVQTGLVTRVSASLAQMEGVWNLSDSWLLNLGLMEAQRRVWRLVLTEMFSNAVLHGSQGDSERTVAVEWKALDQEVVLGVEDSGQGLSDTLIEHPKLPDDPLLPSGRGLFLIRHYVDRWTTWRGSRGFRLEVSRRHHEVFRGVGEHPELTQALEEISQCYEALAGFYRLGSAMIESEDILAFVGHVLEDLQRLLNAHLLNVSFTESLQPVLLGGLMQLDYAVTASLLVEREKRVLEGEESFYWESVSEITLNPRLESMERGFTCPIIGGGRMLGVLTVARGRGRRPFNAGELNLARTFSDLLGIAIAHADSQMQRTREREALRELDLIRRLESELAPDLGVPISEHWELSIFRQSAGVVAGDVAEAIVTTSGRLIVAVVDVMGKGVTAFLFASILRSLLRIIAESDPSLEELLRQLNRHLKLAAGRTSLFATGVFLDVDRAKDRLAWINAGHCPVLLRTREGQWIEGHASTSPLGIFSDENYRSTSLSLGKVERVTTLTDGYFEWTCEGRTWGWSACSKLVKSIAPELNAEETARALETAIVENLDEGGEMDDRTLMVWKNQVMG